MATHHLFTPIQPPVLQNLYLLDIRSHSHTILLMLLSALPSAHKIVVIKHLLKISHSNSGERHFIITGRFPKRWRKEHSSHSIMSIKKYPAMVLQNRLASGVHVTFLSSTCSCVKGSPLIPQLNSISLIKSDLCNHPCLSISCTGFHIPQSAGISRFL